MRLRWHYGEQLVWRTRMIVLTLEPDSRRSGPRERGRYTSPSHELTRGDGAQAVVPGFNLIEAYETAIANLAPELERRPKPERVEEVLAWAEEPLATAEVALVMQLGLQKTRAALSRVATPLAAGADFYWTLTESAP